MKFGLPPLLCSEPRILILGSLPSDMSIQKQEYYGNPTNLFWKVLSGVFEESVPLSYDDKKALLERNGIVLWDVFSAAVRDGSLDANIRNGEFNDIISLLKSYPGIRIVATNGGASEKALKKYFRQKSFMPDGIRVLHLKSTSSMVRSSGWTLARLISQWQELKTLPFSRP